ncbi:MAG: PadR family transcriptional regulator [Pseudomonadota bacterium]
MNRTSKQKPLTELEGTALAIMSREGPCTPYLIKEAFRNSPSEYWSGSAGAVYPMMKRLEARKLIASRADETDGRARREFSLTAAGKTAMKAWLLNADRAAGFGFDPLRTRLFFIELMTAEERRTFLGKTREKMQGGPPAPDTDLPHVKPLHTLWSQYRINVLKAFTKKFG